MTSPRKALVAALLAFLALLAGLALRSRRPPPEGERPKAVVTEQIGPGHWIVSRSEKDAYLADPAVVARHLTMAPNPGETEKSVASLSITHLDPGSPMHAAGLRKEDRILKVNGTPIGDLGRAVNLLHEIRATSRLTLEVERGGKTIPYVFEFK